MGSLRAKQAQHDLNVYLATSLMDMYAKCGGMTFAQMIFEKLAFPNVVSWTTIILGYADNGKADLAFKFYTRMKEKGCLPDCVTIVAALKACSRLAAEGENISCLEKGRAIHTEAIKGGHEGNIQVANTLMYMYAKCGSMSDAQLVFDKLQNRTVVSWTTLLLGYAESGEEELVLPLFMRMHDQGCVPDSIAFISVLKACAGLAEKEEGKQVQGKVVKSDCLEKGRAIHKRLKKYGFHTNAKVETSLLDMYAKCGSMSDARSIFDKMTHHTVISWNVLILGYVENGESKLALQLYTRMQEEGFVLNCVTYLAALKAFGSLAALEAGKRIHDRISKRGLDNNSFIKNCLVDFYGKCGSMVDAQLLFDKVERKCLVTWNALIAGYSRQGDAERVFDLFDKMQEVNIQPNEITFLSVLTSCSHAGLVDRAKAYFHSMHSNFGINAGIEHYTCMVDLLGRANYLNDALAMVENMPFKPALCIWGALLGACRKWTNVSIGRIAFDSILRLDDKMAVAYVSMANIYSCAEMYEDTAEIMTMKRNAEAGVEAWKKPVQSSWTDNSGKVHVFMVGGTGHVQSQSIYTKLKDIMCTMKERGYVPRLQNVTCEDEKGISLCGHSERLAIACGLINTEEGATIRIVKNLRVCDDCHQAIAFISKIEQRSIICRDNSRFHIFTDGKCSCGDFW